MMPEAQAPDLYMGYADKGIDKDVKDILLGLADEEKGHLRGLANILDKKTET